MPLRMEVPVPVRRGVEVEVGSEVLVEEGEVEAVLGQQRIVEWGVMRIETEEERGGRTRRGWKKGRNKEER